MVPSLSTSRQGSGRIPSAAANLLGCSNPPPSANHQGRADAGRRSQRFSGLLRGAAFGRPDGDVVELDQHNVVGLGRGPLDDAVWSSHSRC